MQKEPIKDYSPRAYSHLANSDLISSTEHSSHSSCRAYEGTRNLLTSVSNLWNTTPISSFDYQNDALGRRTKRIDSASITNGVIRVRS